MNRFVKYAFQTGVAALVIVTFVAAGLFALELRARSLVAAPAPISGEPKLKTYCEAAGAGIQQTMHLNQIIDGSIRYWMPDVDLVRFPPKEHNEYRIILIGGLGDQLNDKPRPRDFVLPDLMQRHVQKLGAFSDKSVKVYNFSAYATNAYQNYLALNLVAAFGGSVAADLIVAHVGWNDWVIPYYFEKAPEVHCGYMRYNAGPNYARRPWERPPALDWAFWLFPNVMERTPFGHFLKSMYDPDYFIKAGRDGYAWHRGIRWNDMADMMNSRAGPFFIDTMKSIKRDQLGAPILLVWPGATESEIKSFGDPQATLGANFYRSMFERSRAELSGYLNDKWWFIDMNEIARDKSIVVSAEPSATAQDFIARAIASEAAVIAAAQGGAK